jgi:hypothetical protein
MSRYCILIWYICIFSVSNVCNAQGIPCVCVYDAGITNPPCCIPTSQPTKQPSTQPSSQPTIRPSSQPSMQPSVQPTSEPSVQPSMQPSSQPSRKPTSQPSRQPSGNNYIIDVFLNHKCHECYDKFRYLCYYILS